MKRFIVKMFAIVCSLVLILSGMAGCKKDEEPKDSGSKSTSAAVKTSAGKTSTAKTATSSKTTSKDTTQEDDGTGDVDDDDNGGWTDPDDDDYPDVIEEEEPIDLGGYTIVVRNQGWGFNGPPVLDPENPRSVMQFESYADIEAKYNCKFDILGMNMGEIRDGVINASMAGLKYCDVINIMSYQVLPAFVNQNLIVPVEDYLPANVEEKFKSFDFSTIGGMWKGIRYGLVQKPFLMSGGGIMFNKNIFMNEGIEFPYDAFFNKTWTWDVMLDIAIKCTRDFNGDGINDQWGFLGVPSYPLLYSNNGSIVEFDENWDPVFGFDIVSNIRAMNFLIEMVNTYKVVDRTSAANIDTFAAGNHAMLASGSNPGINLKGRYSFNDWGFVGFPMGPDANEYVAANEEPSIDFFVNNHQDITGIVRAFMDMKDIDPEEPYYVADEDQQNQRMKATLPDYDYDMDRAVWMYLLDKQKIVFTNYFAPLKGRVNNVIINPTLNMEVPLMTAIDSLKPEVQSIFDSYEPQ